MFTYLRLPWKTSLFLACHIVLLARHLNVATANSSSCEERDIPTGIRAIHANLAYLAETFSGIVNQQIHISSDLTNQELEELLVQLVEIAPNEAREFLDYVSDVYNDMVEDWVMRCSQTRLRKRGDSRQEKRVAATGDNRDDKITGETYSLLWSQLKRDDTKHPLYRVPRSASRRLNTDAHKL